MFTLAASICICYLLMWARDSFKENNRKGMILSYVCLAIGIGTAYALCRILPDYIENYDGPDYGFSGVMLPALTILFKNKYAKLGSFGASLAWLCLTDMKPIPVQWYCLLSLVVLFLYNGKKGKYNLKYLFYLYYPLHLILLYIIHFSISG